MSPPVLRVARSTAQLLSVAAMYEAGLGLVRLASFEDHAGFDGVILGRDDLAWHLEFTFQRGGQMHTLTPPSPENLLVLYLPEREDWQRQQARMEAAGFLRRVSSNPYWDECGATFEDIDGYRVVLANRGWPA